MPAPCARRAAATSWRPAVSSRAKASKSVLRPGVRRRSWQLCSPINSPACPIEMSRGLILIGLVLVTAGLLWPVLSKLGLGRLPGDIVIKGEHGGLYFPLLT